MKLRYHFSLHTATPLVWLPVLLFPFLFSCSRMLDVGAPSTSTSADIIYTTDALAIAAVTGLYYNASNIAFNGTPTLSNISLYAGLSADELILYSGAYVNLQYYTFYTNSLSSTTAGGEFWSNIYSLIFNANDAYAGLSASTSLNANVKKQLLGEVKFVRAFCYYYLVTLYGDVPLVLTTDYKTNAYMARTSQAEVWAQIINDLSDASANLSTDFLSGSLTTTTSERVRPTKWAAQALLARVYLYQKNWAEADKQASFVISNTNLFDTTSLNNTFLKNSKEAIWQLQPVKSGENTLDARTFILPATGPNASVNPISLSSNLINAFETGDKRKSNWIASIVSSTDGFTYYYPYKYKLVTTAATSASEHMMLLRVAEQYLIRAEARAMENMLTGANGAINDLNYIRARAGLPASTATTQADIVTAVLKEKRLEFFTEWGTRWLDLKRSGTIDAVMSVYSPIKGGTWQSTWAYYPVASQELQTNKALVQTQGYNP